MLLFIDLGNTNIAFAVLSEQGEIKLSFRIATDIRKTYDQYALEIISLFALKDFSADKINHIVISSVVPDLEFTFRELSHKYFSLEAIFLNKDHIKLNINIERPEDVGIDRLINSYAALSKYKRNSIVIDFGTATTFDIALYGNTYEGGIICPGANLSLKALRNATAKLPNVSIQKVNKIVGKSTTEAMKSGIYYGYLCMITGIIERIKAEYNNTDMKVITTGGLATLFAHDLHNCSIDTNLTIEGMYYIYKELKD